MHCPKSVSWDLTDACADCELDHTDQPANKEAVFIACAIFVSCTSSCSFAEVDGGGFILVKVPWNLSYLTALTEANLFSGISCC